MEVWPSPDSGSPFSLPLINSNFVVVQGCRGGGVRGEGEMCYFVV